MKDKREFEVWFSGVEALRKGQLSPQDIEAIKTSIKAEGGDKVQVVFDNYNFSTKVVIREGRMAHSQFLSWLHVCHHLFSLCHGRVLDASDLYTWGDGKSGKLGHGEDTDEFNPRILEALLGRDIVGMACGSAHTITVTGFFFFFFFLWPLAFIFVF